MRAERTNTRSSSRRARTMSPRLSLILFFLALCELSFAAECYIPPGSLGHSLRNFVDESSLIVIAEPVEPIPMDVPPSTYGQVVDLIPTCILSIHGLDFPMNTTTIRVNGLNSIQKCTVVPNGTGPYMLLLGGKDAPYEVLHHGLLHQGGAFLESQLLSLLKLTRGDCLGDSHKPCKCARCTDDEPQIDEENPPWQAMVRLSATKEPLCNAIMVTDCDKFVTSASCLRGYSQVEIGGREVHSVEIHERYKGKLRFDVALLHVHSNDCFEHLKPICLFDKKTQLKKGRLIVYHSPDDKPVSKRVTCSSSTTTGLLSCSPHENETAIPTTAHLNGSALVAEQKHGSAWTVQGIFKTRMGNQLLFTRLRQNVILRWLKDELEHDLHVPTIPAFTTQIPTTKAPLSTITPIDSIKDSTTDESLLDSASTDSSSGASGASP